jgi:hypothetical protein
LVSTGRAKAVGEEAAEGEGCLEETVSDKPVAKRHRSAKSEEKRIVKQEAVTMLCTVGSKTKSSVPFGERLWARRRFRAVFEPSIAGLWLSTESGWCEAGAGEFPFVVFFEPTEGGVFETTLIVSFGDLEVQTPIVASTGGKHRRHRRRE